MLVVAGALFVVTGPLRGNARESDEHLEAERAELDALKEAKYREIRDAELDYRTGKLSEHDWRMLDRTLRAEAVELLKRLDRLEPPPQAAPAAHGGPRPAGLRRRRRDLPRASALGQGRGDVRRVRRRRGRRVQRRLADGAQPGSLDDPVRRGLRGEHDADPQNGLADVHAAPRAQRGDDDGRGRARGLREQAREQPLA